MERKARKPKPDIRRRIKMAADENAVRFGCYWDDSDFQQFKLWCSIFALQHEGDWEGKPIELLDFQEEDIFGPMLSWKRPDGSYRFNLNLIFSPKKIGKTTSIAALAGWRASTRRRQKIFVVASKVDQAQVLFDCLVAFTQHPELAKRWHVNLSKLIITDRVTKSKIRVMACNPSGISGPSVDLMILDEAAEFPGHHAQKIWDRIKFGGAAKRNSQIVVITTPAHEYMHLGYRLYQRAVKLIKGEERDDLATLPVVYGIPTDCDWKDPKLWLKHLPHIGKTVPLSFYETELKRAFGDPLEELGFRIYLLGQYVRGTSVFVDMPAWAKCRCDLGADELKGKPAVLGLDNGGANDLLAVSALIPLDGRIHVETMSAMTESALHKKNKTGQTHFQAWADRGLIEVIEGETIKIDRVISLLERFYARYQVKALAYDPWQLQELQARFLKLRRLTIETPQIGKYLSPLILEFERKVLETTFAHDSNPVLDFCLENFQVKENKFGKLEFDKSDARSKIDLACSTVIALNALPEIGRAVDWNLPPVL